MQRNLKTEVLPWKRIKYFSFTLCQRYLKRNNRRPFWICVWGKLGTYSVSQTNSNVPYRFVFILWIKSVCTLFRGTLLFFHHFFAFAVSLVLAFFFINFVLFITSRVFVCTCTTLFRALYLTETQEKNVSPTTLLSLLPSPSENRPS